MMVQKIVEIRTTAVNPWDVRGRMKRLVDDPDPRGIKRSGLKQCIFEFTEKKSWSAGM